MKKEFKIIVVFLLALTFSTGCGAKEFKEKKEEIKCEEGYELTEGKCIKILDQKDAIASYSCQDGFTLSQDKSECTKTETKNAKIDNPCPSDYTFSNGTCTKTEMAEIIINKSCIDQYGEVEGDVCHHTQTKQATTRTTCPNGKVYVALTNDCWTAWGIKCSYSILSGYCLSPSSEKPITAYACPTGYTLEGTTCIRKYDTTAIQKKSCPSGFKAQGDTCVRTTTTKITGTYYCDSDFTLNGTKCTKTSVEKPNITYSCESEEYTLKDKVCIQYEEKETIVGS